MLAAKKLGRDRLSEADLYQIDEHIEVLDKALATPEVHEHDIARAKRGGSHRLVGSSDTRVGA
jgi:hypothetical protein